MAREHGLRGRSWTSDGCGSPGEPSFGKLPVRALSNRPWQRLGFADGYAVDIAYDSAMNELTLAEAANRLAVSASTLRGQVKNGRIDARLAGKTYLVTPEEVERYRRESRGRTGRPRRQAAQAVGGLDPLAVDRRALQTLAEREGIRSLAVFGSTARGDARPGSDVDVVIDLEPGSEVGLFEHARIAEELAVLFGRQVDLVTGASLKPRFREAVALEAITLVAR